MTAKAPEKKAPPKKAVAKPAAKKVAAKKPASKTTEAQKKVLAKISEAVSVDLKKNPPKAVKEETAKPPMKAKVTVEKKAVKLQSLGVDMTSITDAISGIVKTAPTVGNDLGPKTLVNVPTRQEVKPKVAPKPTPPKAGSVLAKDIFAKRETKREGGFNFKYVS